MPRKVVRVIEPPVVQEILVEPRSQTLTLVFAYKGRAKTYQRIGAEWYISQGDTFVRLPQGVAVRSILDQQLPKLEEEQ